MANLGTFGHIDTILSKREAKKQLFRSTIVESAVKLFSKKGIKSTAIADIMKDAGLGIGTFYNYFESKDDLLRNLLIQLAASIRQYAMRMLSEKNTQGEVLESMTIYSADLLERNRFLLPLFMTAVDKSALPPDHRIIKKPLPFKDMFNNIIMEGQQRGEFRKDVPSEIITEMFHAMFQTASFSSLPLRYQENVRYKLKIVLAGIIADKDEYKSNQKKSSDEDVQEAAK